MLSIAHAQATTSPVAFTESGFFTALGDMLGTSPEVAALIFFVLVVWTTAWKGLALWRAAHRNDLGWFVALLILNTVGILEIIYIFVFTRKKKAVETEM